MDVSYLRYLGVKRNVIKGVDGAFTFVEIELLQSMSA